MNNVENMMTRKQAAWFWLHWERKMLSNYSHSSLIFTSSLKLQLLFYLLSSWYSGSAAFIECLWWMPSILLIVLSLLLLSFIITPSSFIFFSSFCFVLLRLLLFSFYNFYHYFLSIFHASDLKQVLLDIIIFHLTWPSKSMRWASLCLLCRWEKWGLKTHLSAISYSCRSETGAQIQIYLIADLMFLISNQLGFCFVMLYHIQFQIV